MEQRNHSAVAAPTTSEPEVVEVTADDAAGLGDSPAARGDGFGHGTATTGGVGLGDGPAANGGVGRGDAPAASGGVGLGNGPATNGSTNDGVGSNGASADGSTGTGSGQTGDVLDGIDDAHYQRRLGSRLRALRRSQGLRLQDVEHRSAGRFKAVVVGSYERGDRAVSAHKLAALAAFYGVPVSELLPDDAWPRRGAAEPSVRIAVDRLRGVGAMDATLAPLYRLVQHVQWLRGDYNGSVLSLRGDDLRTVAVALGVEPEGLEAWLEERDLLAAAG